MFSKTKRVHAPAQNFQIHVPDSSSPLSIRLTMKEVYSEYGLLEPGEQYLIQFWQCSSPQGSKANGFNVTTEGQPFHIPQPSVYLEQYRQNCVDMGCCFVGQNTEVGTWLVGRAIQKRLADQGTIGVDGSHNQKLGLLVMPVLLDRGTHKETVGVIELVTLVPKTSYGEEFDRINNLLKNESLESGGMGKMIKFKYGKDNTMIKFPLYFSAKFKGLKINVADRIKTTTFSIGYIDTKDTKDIYRSISSDEDLNACIQKFKEATFITMVVKLTA
ncbi:PB1 domain-containing protein [Artemisia annua]|uniref:PB1 domain-containing protein n=1 Tax=Artemisia annua TaxID=35608 RepID=A0A2U1KI23_ARTAN|nr:PB1 domain-containing protein [Artemisia annua]